MLAERLMAKQTLHCCDGYELYKTTDTGGDL